mmetsp:Transcript_24151/g.48792  ORF Transcript_24151/g.48792 Transcript_24151/m.48792 type:complete len:81 (-) Transcript_24151:1169-1411(-)
MILSFDSDFITSSMIVVDRFAAWIDDEIFFNVTIPRASLRSELGGKRSFPPRKNARLANTFDLVISSKQSTLDREEEPFL